MGEREDKEMLRALALQSSSDFVTKLKREYGKEHFYAFFFVPSSGFINMGISVSSRESLKRVTESVDEAIDESVLAELDAEDRAFIESYQTPQHYYEVVAAEWPYVGLFQGGQRKLSRTVARLQAQERLNEEAFEEVFTDTLVELKESGVLAPPLFEEDVLMGIQFMDQDQPDLVERVSAKVNSREWHQKLCEGYWTPTEE